MFPPHGALADASRLSRIPRSWGAAADALLLLGAGTAAAALAVFVDLGLRIPGHAILPTVVPVALGMALVPRRGAGSAAGAAAFAAAGLMGGFPRTVGWGSFASLVLTGPILDLALRRPRSGAGLYLGLALAGLAANMLSFGVRLGAKVAFHDGGRPLAQWWPVASVSHAACGAAAGLLAAALFFRWRPPAGTRA